MTQLGEAGVVSDLFRGLFSIIDGVIYGLLSIIYQIFFNVASANIINKETMFNIFGRIQLILGVFMLFQLGMTVIRGLVDPDSFTDSKKGVGNLVTRIITAMVLLACIVPIHMPNGGNNEYEVSVNNNGLLFGTLYSLQHRVLASNTIGKIILGNDTTYSTNISDNSSTNELAEASQKFSTGIFRSFFTINLKPEDQRKKHEEGRPDEAFADNRICEDNIDDQLEVYENEDTPIDDLLNLTNEKCTVGGGVISNTFTNKYKRYVFAYNIIISSIVGGFVLVMLLSFTVDIAIRAIKLAILRLLAPIPIISYMNPSGKGDDSLKTWTGQVTSTYLDLFLRLSLIMFVIFICQDILENGISLGISGGMIGVLSTIFIIIGLFMFAKKAPKFIYDVLGIKGEPGGLFSGLGAIVGAASGIGAARASARASREADIANYMKQGMTREQAEQKAKSLGNRGKHLLAGITGGVSGAAAGVNAAAGAKDHQMKAVLSAMSKRNSDIIARGQSGSTAFGRAKSAAHTLFTGEPLSAAAEREIKSLTDQQKALNAIKSRVSGEMVKQDWTYGSAYDKNTGIGMKSITGNVIKGNVNYKDFMARKNAAMSAGQRSFTVSYIDEETKKELHATVDMAEAERYQGLILKNNEDNYIRSVTSGEQEDVELKSLINDAKSAGVDFKINSRSSYTGGAEKLGQLIRKKSRENAGNAANDYYSTKK